MARLETRDGYCTGNYAMVGGGQNWLEVDELPTEDRLKLKAYTDELVFDETRYEGLFKEQVNQVAISEKKNKIFELQLMLENTDYKIIKCYEYSLAGEMLPYNITSLHEERQAIRYEINSIELEILELEG